MNDRRVGRGRSASDGAVFISYSSRDDALARRIVGVLDAAGVQSWFAPRDINPARTYASQITEAISRSSALLALVTENSRDNKNVIREVDLAYRKDKELVPVVVTSRGLGSELEYYFGPLHQIISAPSGVVDAVGLFFGLQREKAAGGGWGPDRRLVRGGEPVTVPMLNSRVDNPSYGDERGFLRIKESAGDNSELRSSMELRTGVDYRLVCFVANDATSDPGVATASGVSLRFAVPDAVTAGETVGVTAFVESADCVPRTVYSSIHMTSQVDMALRYVPKSAVIRTGGDADGALLADEIFSGGTLIGIDALDGSIAPGRAAVVTVDFRADAPNFTVSVRARRAGGFAWVDTVRSRAGRSLDVLVSYTNTGSVLQENVVVKVALPFSATYVDGSTEIANSVNPQGAPCSDDITTRGLNIGRYDPGGNCFLKFTIALDEHADPRDLEAGCRVYGTVITANGNKQDWCRIEL